MDKPMPTEFTAALRKKRDDAPRKGILLPMEEPTEMVPAPPVSTTMPIRAGDFDFSGAVLPEGQDPYLAGTPFHPGDPKANPTPIPMSPEQIENERRRMESAGQGYGWGGRRLGPGLNGGLASILGGTAAPAALGAPAGPSLREALMRLLKGGQ